MRDLTKLTASAASELIRDGSVSSEELVTACLERIESRDGKIGAFAHLDAEHALQAARMADQWRATGNGTGPLHGVPIAVKDIIDTADYPTEYGSSVFSGRRTRTDAACVAQLRSAGAIIIGKTVTTELALLTPAKTCNPKREGHTPGGSSAGSAAAVADHMVPVALGTQTAGSILRPASYCGVYGFKPTYGLISRTGVLMQSHTLDTVGLLANSVEDLALVTDCMSAFDPGDAASFPRSQPRLYDIARADPPTTPLFAFVKTPAWADADLRLHEAFGELIGELGAQVEEVEIGGLDRVIAWQQQVQLAENTAYYGQVQDRARTHLSSGLNERLDKGAKVPVRDYIEAVAAREPAYRAVSETFERYHAILTPASPGPAPEGMESTGSPVFNGLWTYLGMPAVSLPLLEVDGLPLGVQLVGPRRDDGRLLRTARWLVQHLESKE